MLKKNLWELSQEEYLKMGYKCNLVRQNPNISSKCKLFLGENEDILRYLIYEITLRGKVDFIYIDPPYSTKNVFTISENKANSISRSMNDSIAYEDTLVGEDYLIYLRKRLILLKELLSEKGSIYIHIDYKIGHYVKIIMDEIFGFNNFRNDITRIKCNPKNFARKAYGNIKDMILFYTKTDDYIWNDFNFSLMDEDIKRLFKKIDKNGRRYTTIPLHAPGETKNGPTGQKWKGLDPPKGRHWRCIPQELDELENQGLIEWSKNKVPRKIIYADEHKGKKIQDIIEFKDPQNPSYPTEKNIQLLELLIKNSSTEDSIILDCFCGSGTTLKAAQNCNRNWIGIDNSEEAIRICKDRLKDPEKRKQMTLFGHLPNLNEFEFYIQKNK